MNIAMEILADAGDQITPCEAYTAIFRLRETDAKRWAFAAYLVGIAAAIALVVAIIMAATGHGGEAVASAVGTIVTGAATTWLWGRRSAVQREAEDFLSKVRQYCPAQKLKMFGLN